MAAVCQSVSHMICSLIRAANIFPHLHKTIATLNEEMRNGQKLENEKKSQEK